MLSISLTSDVPRRRSWSFPGTVTDLWFSCSLWMKCVCVCVCVCALRSSCGLLTLSSLLSLPRGCTSVDWDVCRTAVLELLSDSFSPSTAKQVSSYTSSFTTPLQLPPPPPPPPLFLSPCLFLFSCSPSLVSLFFSLAAPVHVYPCSSPELGLFFFKQLCGVWQSPPSWVITRSGLAVPKNLAMCGEGDSSRDAWLPLWSKTVFQYVYGEFVFPLSASHCLTAHIW